MARIETLKAIGEYFGRKPNTVYYWIRDHEFPAGKLPGGQWTTTESAIEKWLVSRGRVWRKMKGFDKDA